MEFALVLPLLVTFGLGVIDTAFVINDSIRLRSSVREGSRLIATYDFATELPLAPAGTTDCGATGIGGAPTNLASKWAACRTLAMLTESGFPAPSVRIRVRMVEANSTAGFDSVGAGTLPSTTNGPAALMVCAVARTSSRTGLLRSLYDSKTLNHRIIMPLQNPSTLTDTERLEADYGASGGTWGFCDPSKAGS